MKKFNPLSILSMRRIVALLILFVFILVPVAMALNMPFRAAVPLAGVSGVYTNAGQSSLAAYAFRLESVSLVGGVSNTFTVSTITPNGTGFATNTVGTKLILAGDYTLILSNLPPLFVGDRVLIAAAGAGITNGTGYITGTEQ